MRDLQKDLEKWITDHDIGAHGEWFYMTGEYIERAIKAEAEVTKWQDVAEQRLENALVVAQKVCRLEAENAKLRKVADAARALVPSEMYQCTRHLYALKHTLDEYDKAKEGQE